MAFIVGETRGTSTAEAKGDRRVLWGALLGVIAAAGFGSSTVVAKEVVTEYATPLVAGAFALLMGSIAMLAVTGRDVATTLQIPRWSFVSLALAGVSTGGGVVSLYFALTHAPVVVVSPLVSMAPIFTLILAQLLIRKIEDISVQSVLGTGLVVGGVIMLVVGRS